MSDFIIRDAVDNDIEAITRIYNEAVVHGGSTADIEPRTVEQRREWVNSHEPRANYPVVVLEVGEGDDAQIAGFASLSQYRNRAGYDGVVEISYYVSGQWQHRGYGTALLTWLESAARERGFRQLVATIFADNKGSTALMRSFGYTRYGLLPKAAFNEKLNLFYDVAYWYKDMD